MLITKKGVTRLAVKRPVIGSQFVGKNTQFFDGRTGEYWEANPLMSSFEEKLQKGLLKKLKRVKLPFAATVKVSDENLF